MRTALALALATTAATAVVLSTPALAITYGGNPTFTIDIDNPGSTLDSTDANLDKIVIVKCDDSTVEQPVDKTIDLVEGWSTTLNIAASDLCELELHWGADVEVFGSDNNGTFEVHYTEAITVLELASPIPAYELLPYTVVAGTPSGGNPSFHTTLQ